MLEFEIFVRPKALQRTRVRAGRKGVYEKASQKKYKESIGLIIQSMLPNSFVLIQKKIKVEIYFYSKNKLRGDIDNYIKMYLDIMNELVYKDDRQVYEIYSKKIDQKEDKIIIKIEEI